MPGVAINVGSPYNVADYVPIYGNYCGPGWTGGQRTTPGASQNDNPPLPVDAIDALCKQHDDRYTIAEWTSDPAEAARIVAEADMTLLRDASSLLAANMLPGTPAELQLSATASPTPNWRSTLSQSKR